MDLRYGALIAHRSGCWRWVVVGGKRRREAPHGTFILRTSALPVDIAESCTAFKRKRPVRVLLLGQSESGKSTTLKSAFIRITGAETRSLTCA
jgi:hypothetical protein